MNTNTVVPNNFFQKYVVHGPKGEIDLRKSVKSFEEEFTAWYKEQGDLKPAIMQELAEYKRLGEGKLVIHTLHQLRLQPSKENTERVINALQELQRAGKITYKTTESGARRGRGAGWMIREDSRAS